MHRLNSYDFEKNSMLDGSHLQVEIVNLNHCVFQRLCQSIDIYKLELLGCVVYEVQMKL